jgi:hypothetical protein
MRIAAQTFLAFSLTSLSVGVGNASYDKKKSNWKKTNNCKCFAWPNNKQLERVGEKVLL